MSAAFAAPASRNAPCPCGSGRRYKDCHGAIAGAGVAPGVLDRLASAADAAKRGDFDTASAICEDALSEFPDHPAALEILARREVESGRAVDALGLLLRAARALDRYALPPQLAYGVWSALNAAFADAVPRSDAAGDATPSGYESWQSRRRGGETECARDVAVVLALAPGARADAAGASVASVLAQTLRPCELAVAPFAGAVVPPTLRPDLVPVDLHVVRGAACRADAIEAAIAATRAPWILVLEAPSLLAPSHLQRLVDEATLRGARWAFSDATIEAAADEPLERLAQASALQDAARTSLAKSDSLGFAFVGQWFPLLGSGAVLFARDLHAAVGGFRPVEGFEAWDFCVRATWEDEPVHVSAATYRHVRPRGEVERPASEREAAQVAIFRPYHARAGRDDAQPPNPFAPSLARWGMRYLRRFFQIGHVLMVDLDTLERFRARVAAAIERARPPMLTPGINLIGFAFGEFGLGESLRALARACDAGGIPFVVNDVDQHLSTRQADRSIAGHVADDVRHRVSLMCVNPDLLKQVQPLLARTREGGGRSIGYWYWELETTPRTWEPAFPVVNEVWCATGFVERAVKRVFGKPVVRIPPPMEVTPVRRYERSEFGLPDGRLLFLFTFDYNSFVKRKNPEAVIEAFKAAFPRGRDDVGLVVKSVNGAYRPERVAAIMALIGDDSRIAHVDRFLSRDETYGLIGATDAYVSLHRSEGLGLGLAEAMALGKPTIATGYSGNLEFMDEANSLLVDYRMVPVAAGDYLVDDDRFVWAEPDVESAARHMRSLADDPALRARIAHAGQRTILTRFTRERTAALIRARLDEIGALASAAAPGTGRADPDAETRDDVATFVSYAQNGEDAILAHVLEGVTNGRYVDVGANDPDAHSVTRAFYDRGWSGINVEPSAEWHARLAAARPRDVNLRVAASDRAGVATLHAFAGTGLSTLDDDVARRHVREGREPSTIEVPARTLAGILDEHAGGEIHFLKIDVEGAEDRVLAGADFARHRPWIVVVESTLPMTGIASHSAWEGPLLAEGYRFAHDDGLNRYYVCEERTASLLARFAERPAWNVVRAVERVASAAGLSPEQRFDPRAAPFLDLDAPEPTLAQPTSQLCTRSQFDAPEYRETCARLCEPPALHRKQWEFVWIVRCLERAGLLAEGRRGLGFGCGREPLAALMAARGCSILATDLGADAAAGHGWIESGQHARALEDLNVRGICEADAFRRRVAFRPVDMNAIPGDLEGFDFVWSSCAFEHLGSIERGLAFVRSAMRCLRPGGLAVHTTEFNVSSNVRTVESRDLSVYRRQDVERLAADLVREGHRVWPLNLQPGAAPVDRYVDLPPYRGEPHLKLRLDQFVITSIGIAVERAG